MIKELLIKEPILKYPDPNKPYTLFTDASKYAWACVLTQEHRYFQHPKTRVLYTLAQMIQKIFKNELTMQDLIEYKVKPILHPITYLVVCLEEVNKLGYLNKRGICHIYVY